MPMSVEWWRLGASTVQAGWSVWWCVWGTNAPEFGQVWSRLVFLVGHQLDSIERRGYDRLRASSRIEFAATGERHRTLWMKRSRLQDIGCRYWSVLRMSWVAAGWPATSALVYIRQSRCSDLQNAPFDRPVLAEATEVVTSWPILIPMPNPTCNSPKVSPRGGRWRHGACGRSRDSLRRLLLLLPRSLPEPVVERP